MLKVEMLAAQQGDAVWIEYGTRTSVHRVLMDAGTPASAAAIRDRIARLPESQRRFDLLVVTHIDTDHIGGVLKLLAERPPGLTFDDVWFNGWEHIKRAGGSRLGPIDGEIMSTFLTKLGWPWNAGFDGGPVMVPREGPPPQKRLRGGLSLGLGSVPRAQFKRWSDDIAVVLDGSVRGAGLPAAAAACADLSEYLRGEIAERRRAPREDLLSRLLAAHEHEDALSEEELIATCVLILLAGHETTTNLIGNGMLALSRHPEEQGRLVREPGLVRSAVEEMLRFDSPVQMTSRIAREPLELGGVRLEPGLEVNLSLASANRDPNQFPDADRFDVARAPNRHLAFGLGGHFCLGAPLARLEAQVAFEALVRRIPRWKLEDEGIRRRPGIVLRGLESLPIAF